MNVRCSIVIPVHGRAGLTRQCLDAIFAHQPEAAFEVIVVDDASPDDTAEVLGRYGDAIRVIRREQNAGFATACNDGAAAAKGAYLVFLNNDTIPLAGWLDALVSVADSEPAVGIAGSKLLFPNETVQHAGVVVCQDGNPRHLYAGFPGDHPAVNKARRFQAVTAASMLVRRDAFERAAGFDTAFRNCLEDTDLCMRLGELGYEVRYCPESVLYHLESVSRGRRSKEIAEAGSLFRERWGAKAERDDLRYYVEDGLLRLGYREVYPVRLEVAPELATVAAADAGRFAELQAQQVADLLRETVRLTAHAADLELDTKAPAGAGLPSAERDGLIEEAERLQLEIHAFQARIAEALEQGAARNGADPQFTPGDRLSYLALKDQVRVVVTATVPPGETLLVVSRGDDSLLELPERRAWHFPREADGQYAGRHPADGAEAVAQLEELRSHGASYLAIPATDAWWLDHYAALARHLEEHAVSLTHRGAPCLVFRLTGASGSR